MLAKSPLLPPADRLRILVTGANGQIGTDLVNALRGRHGIDAVVATDVRTPAKATPGPFHFLDVCDAASIERLVVEHRVNTVVHNAALMSVLGELRPQDAIRLNVDGVRNVLEVCRKHNLRLYAPSTMAVFNEQSGKVMTKDDTMLNPTTVYGITKVFLEQLGSYYHKKFGVDFRSIRYPGIISAEAPPGGGTTDYAVWMYHYALQNKTYTCPVLPTEPLPMMYMPDCLDATISLIEAPRAKLSRCVYNLSAFSFTPEELVKSINAAGLPDFKNEYKRGFQQDIAASWPDSIDDSNFRRDLGWSNKYDLNAMTKAMLSALRRLEKEGIPLRVESKL
jgi:threonine 3-dehydrogenase